MYHLDFISDLKWLIFYQRRYQNSSKRKKYKAAVARGIDETWNAVQLNGFLGKKHFIFIYFSKSNFTCAFICFSVCQSTFLSYFFLALSIIQDFSLNFARTLGRAVDKLLNSSRVNRPFYSCLLSDLAFEWKRGWRWPCFDTDLTAFVV